MNRVLKIGTRDSQLAVWQAAYVQKELATHNIKAELVFIKSEGDVDTTTPLYELGVTGIFSKALDIALLDERIDIAVHSMKDVPTQPAKYLKQAAVLRRGNYRDILVYKDLNKIQHSDEPCRIATSSIRRAAQWLHRYPHHTIENIRGNVNTRMKKFEESEWDGVIFAAAGLERINLRPHNSTDLNWMVPAPSQGAIVILCREKDREAFKVCHLINDEVSALCTGIEKDFLRTLEGGCSTPLSALALKEGEMITFEGNLCSTNGRELFSVSKASPLKDARKLGRLAAEELLHDASAKAVIDAIRNG